MARLLEPGTAFGTTPTTSAYADAAAEGSAGNAARGDHTHGRGTHPLGPPAAKTADENKTSDTTLAIDADLQVSVSANRRMHFHLVLSLSVHATPDLKWAWTLPNGASGHQGFVAYRGANKYEDDIAAAAQVVAAVGDDVFIIEGVLLTGDGGIFGLEWAQNASSVEDCIIKEGSALVLIDGGAT